MNTENESLDEEVVAPTANPKKRTVRKSTKSTRKTSVKKAAKKKVAKKNSSKISKSVKTKLVRDSFAFPENEYATLISVKKTCLQSGLEIKKTELIRIGLALVNNLSVARIKSQKAKLTPISAGRPKK